MGLNSTFQINVFCKIFGKAGREGIGSRGEDGQVIQLE